MTEDDKDQRRKAKADEIITKMHDENKSREDIAAQKKANKQGFGHEGENDPEKH